MLETLEVGTNVRTTLYNNVDPYIEVKFYEEKNLTLIYIVSYFSPIVMV